jgi:prepilin-type N-terminal cleavage/methylation domain-containing protein/prepilin-type processing-associated H-X9-DG protein
MLADGRTTRHTFTLIELLVVIAVMALLAAALLPSLRCAREEARAAKCGVQLRSLGRGMLSYVFQNDGWIPGINTTGVAATIAARSGDVDALRRVGTPVQSYDWMSPALRHETELGNNRAERFQTMINEYRCPSLAGLKIDYLYPLGHWRSPDREDFTEEIIASFSPLSYLMPAHFQWWGQYYRDTIIAEGGAEGDESIEVMAEVAGSGFAAVHRGRYRSRLDQLGPPSRKIAVADGMRYLTRGGDIDFDVDPDPNWFGSFASNGGWWAGSQAYGVKSGTKNWDGTPVHQSGRYPAAEGRNLIWSYRHGCWWGSERVTSSAHDNRGRINAMFFDGHVARLSDRASRNIEHWYPTGTTAQPGQGLTDVPEDFEVP